MHDARYATMIELLEVPVTTSQLTMFYPRKRFDSRLHPFGRSHKTRITPLCALPAQLGWAENTLMLRSLFQ